MEINILCVYRTPHTKATTHLHTRDESSTLKAFNLGQKRAASTVNHHFIQHLVHFARIAPTPPVHLTQKAHAQGHVHAALVWVVCIAALELAPPSQYPPQIFSVGVKFMVCEESHGAEVEADDGGDVRVEERARVQNNAVAAQTHNKINHLR